MLITIEDISRELSHVGDTGVALKTLSEVKVSKGSFVVISQSSETNIPHESGAEVMEYHLKLNDKKLCLNFT